MVKRVMLLSAVVLTAFVAAQRAHAGLIPFHVVTSNGSYYDDPGLDFRVEVSNGLGNADFTFYNFSDPSLTTSITDVYFDDGVLLTLTGCTNSAGYTSFSSPANPGDLPDAPDFTATDGFSADSDAPGLVANGVQYDDGSGDYEWVTMHFSLQWIEAENRYADLSDVYAELLSGELKIGLHVQSFPDGSSNSFVNDPVPEPASLCLLSLGAIALLRSRKRPA